jgi:hypothetical protein
LSPLTSSLSVAPLVSSDLLPLSNSPVSSYLLPSDTSKPNGQWPALTPSLHMLRPSTTHHAATLRHVPFGIYAGYHAGHRREEDLRRPSRPPAQSLCYLRSNQVSTPTLTKLFSSATTKAASVPASSVADMVASTPAFHHHPLLAPLIWSLGCQGPMGQLLADRAVVLARHK